MAAEIKKSGEDFHQLRNAMLAAENVGNRTMSAYFQQEMQECEYVWGEGPDGCLNSQAWRAVQKWKTKALAVKAAQRVGWRACDVRAIEHRLFGSAWAMVDGRFGLVSKSFYAKIATNPRAA